MNTFQSFIDFSNKLKLRLSKVEKVLKISFETNHTGMAVVVLMDDMRTFSYYINTDDKMQMSVDDHLEYLVKMISDKVKSLERPYIPDYILYEAPHLGKPDTMKQDLLAYLASLSFSKLKELHDRTLEREKSSSDPKEKEGLQHLHSMISRTGKLMINNIKALMDKGDLLDD